MILFSRFQERLCSIFKVLLVTISLLLVIGCTQRDMTETPSQSHELRARNQRRYTELCAGCHGVHARGGVGPDLTAYQFKYGKNRSAIIQSILEGRPGGMPAYGSHLNKEQAAEMAEYLLTF